MLYRGTAGLDVAAGVDGTRSVTLARVGSAAGSGGLTVKAADPQRSASVFPGG